MIRLSQLKAQMPPADAVDDGDVRELVDTYERLLAEATKAQEAASAADRKVKEARQADVDGYARALRDGKTDPGSSGVEKAEGELEAARRHADAAARATLDAREELARLVADRRGELAAAAAGQVADARAGLRDAVEALEVAHGRLGSALAGAAWVRGFPERTKGGAPNHLPGLRGPNGDAYVLDAVLAAMRELTADPAPAAA